MKFYGKLIGSGYLIDVLKPIIVELAESNKSMEVFFFHFSLKQIKTNK